jgi:hypothetical protein
MRGEGVSKRMRMDRAHSGAASHLLNQLPEDDAGHGAAGAGEEEAIGGGLGAGRFDGDELRTELDEVVVQRAKGGATNGDDSFFAAFAKHADDAEIGVHIFQSQFREL